MLKKRERAIISRVNREQVEAIKKSIPNNVELRPNETAKIIVLRREGFKIEKTGGRIGILSAGTSDIPVAEEALITAQMMGNKTDYLYDVGVAGIHRLLTQRDKIFSASVLIVVAGMEGALPSVVAGLVAAPVIAVPTSVGYGASFGGLAPLLTMLNSCAPGVAVVNIDNGFGAGYMAAVINRLTEQERKD